MKTYANILFLPDGPTRFVRVNLADLVYAEAADGWVNLLVPPHTYRLQTNIGTVEAQLPDHLFRRVSRQHIVNIGCIEAYEPGHIWLEGTIQLPLGPQYRQSLLDVMPILRTKLPASR